MRDALPLKNVLNTLDCWMPSREGRFAQEAHLHLDWSLSAIQQKGHGLNDGEFYNALSELISPSIPIGLGDYTRSSSNVPPSPSETVIRTPEQGLRRRIVGEPQIPITPLTFDSSPPLPRTPVPGPPLSSPVFLTARTHITENEGTSIPTLGRFSGHLTRTPIPQSPLSSSFSLTGHEILRSSTSNLMSKAYPRASPQNTPIGTTPPRIVHRSMGKSIGSQSNAVNVEETSPGPVSSRPRGSSDTEVDSSYVPSTPGNESSNSHPQNPTRENQVVAVVRTFRTVMQEIIQRCSEDFSQTLTT